MKKSGVVIFHSPTLFQWLVGSEQGAGQDQARNMSRDAPSGASGPRSVSGRFTEPDLRSKIRPAGRI